MASGWSGRWGDFLSFRYKQRFLGIRNLAKIRDSAQEVEL